MSSRKKSTRPEPSPPRPDHCPARCPEFPAWTCGRPPGHPGRHETALGGLWRDPGTEPVEPDLKDVYFCVMGGRHGRRAAADAVEVAS